MFYLTWGLVPVALGQWLRCIPERKAVIWLPLVPAVMCAISQSTYQHDWPFYIVFSSIIVLVGFSSIFVPIIKRRRYCQNKCHRKLIRRQEIPTLWRALAFTSVLTAPLVFRFVRSLRPRPHGCIFIWKRKHFVAFSCPVHTKTMKTMYRFRWKRKLSKTISRVERFENATVSVSCGRVVRCYFASRAVWYPNASIVGIQIMREPARHARTCLAHFNISALWLS